MQALESSLQNILAGSTKSKEGEKNSLGFGDKANGEDGEFLKMFENLSKSSKNASADVDVEANLKKLLSNPKALLDVIAKVESADPELAQQLKDALSKNGNLDPKLLENLNEDQKNILMNAGLSKGFEVSQQVSNSNNQSNSVQQGQQTSQTQLSQTHQRQDAQTVNQQNQMMDAESKELSRSEARSLSRSMQGQNQQAMRQLQANQAQAQGQQNFQGGDDFVKSFAMVDRNRAVAVGKDGQLHSTRTSDQISGYGRAQNSFNNSLLGVNAQMFMDPQNTASLEDAMNMSVKSEDGSTDLMPKGNGGFQMDSQL